MKRIKILFFLSIFLTTLSCAYFSRMCPDVQTDEFLNKFTVVNEELLGDMKYDDAKADLRTFGYHTYADLFHRLKLTDDRKTVLDFIDKNASKRKFVVFHDTFIMCLESKKKGLIVCDNADTAGTDLSVTKRPLPAFDEVCNPFIKNTEKMATEK